MTPQTIASFSRRAALACALAAAPAMGASPAGQATQTLVTPTWSAADAAAALEGSPAPAPEAQNPAGALARDAKIDLPDAMREQLDTIGRYAAEVNRRGGTTELPVNANAGPPALRPSRQIELGVDPFEVSPQLRDGRGARFTGLPGAGVLELQRRVQVRAVLRTARGALAQLLINNKDVITLMDKELIDLGEMGTFQAEIRDGTVSLSDPGNPQGKRVVLR
ncbi:MAG: hypothetical protein LBS49_11550 [Candidatus Accumulibacter sp.]|jgi:hypothetical protein|nr:hypothetical protein [Accumulibacter sp.]